MLQADNVDKRYQLLLTALNNAYQQASEGKGKDRHATEDNFEDQPILWIERQFKSFDLGQAVKKIHESQRLPKDHAISELYGAIIFIAARIIYLEEGDC